ncbi:hypothetical protein [Actinoplanes sp. G11-F43]|uniref:hypothetical protein n=1 Tax=Actinoplanes sp. G11-F43 TaxID=3424130 RepID=UPI003D344375
MLTRRLLAVAASVLLATLAAAAPALADPTGGGDCGRPDCTVWGGDGGDGGDNGRDNDDGGSGGGSSGCHYGGRTVRCSIPSLGWFNNRDGCYYQKSPPPPPGLGDEPPAGEVGNWYTITCGMYNGGPVEARIEWVPGAPLQQPPDPEELARRALATITLKGADIGMAPQQNGAGLVYLPVWMWTTVTPNTWGPIGASASDSGLTVTITAKAERIVWDMGDGHSVTCTSPGTKFTAGNGGKQSPTCGYTYAKPSRDRAGGKYRVTATTFWRVDWAGGGSTGVINTDRTASTTVQIDELQVVNR